MIDLLAKFVFRIFADLASMSESLDAHYSSLKETGTSLPGELRVKKNKFNKFEVCHQIL